MATGAFVVLLPVLAISPWFLVSAALLVLLGASGVAFSTTINTRLQLTVPDHLRGRVMSIFFLLFAGSTPVGGYLTGLMAEAFGVPATLAVLSAICCAGLIVALVYRAGHASAIEDGVPAPPVPAEVP